MKVIVCTSKIPFIKGGNEIVVEWLQQELKKHKIDVDEVSLPLSWKREEDVIKSYLAWRMLNLDEGLEINSDLVICTKFPSYFVYHRNKIIWLTHQFRQIYDWAGTEMGYDFDTVAQLDTKSKIIEMDNLSFKKKKKIFVISKNVHDRLYKYNGFDSEVIYPFPPNKEEYYCSNYNDYLLCTGRLEKNKRVNLILEALKIIPNKIRLIITGEGSEKKLLQEKAKEYNLDNRVEFLGWVSRKQLMELYAGAYAVIFTAYDEDYGLTVPEAYLSKKAIITLADSGGAAELVKNDETGIVCPPYAEGLAEGIIKALSNKEKIIEMGVNGFEIINKWSWELIINKLIS